MTERQLDQAHFQFVGISLNLKTRIEDINWTKDLQWSCTNILYRKFYTELKKYANKIFENNLKLYR